jgi:hypothetical protein
MVTRVRLNGFERKSLATAIKGDIDAACVALYEESEQRAHLGASIIGEKCARKLWYSFRWFHKEQFSAKMYRLFNRGHKEEDRLIEWIKSISATVFSHDENTGKQFRISGVDGHYGGSLDSIMYLPPKYHLQIPFLGEFKTHNERSFKSLAKNGVIMSKPKHYAQMCAYGSAEIYNFDYAIYFAINKNTDDLYVEVVELDHNFGKKLLAKAQDIITAKTAPGRVSASPAYSECTYCSMQGICHKGEAVDVNCRSCRHSEPFEDAEWVCRLADQIIPRHVLLKGCEKWQVFPH